MKMEADMKEVNGLFNKMRRLPAMLSVVLDEEFDEYGKILLATTIMHASGRPGPNIRSGAYIGSMQLIIRPRSRTVINTSPQSNRLEYGYVGTDSLGRLYNQAPLPHFRPALLEVRPAFHKAIRAAPKEAWRRL